MHSKPIIVVHDGKFHTDDVFAVATLRLALTGKGPEVIRTREQEWFKKGDYVVDVGLVCDSQNNRFDHHQPEGAGKRANGIPYSSFGLVWQKFGKELCGSQEAADVIDKKLVSYIDAADNGVDIVEQKYQDAPVYSVVQIINLFRQSWRKEEVDKDREFLGAVEWAQKILSMEIESAAYVLEVERVIENRYKLSDDRRLLVFDGEGEVLGWEIPVRRLSLYPEPIYFVMPKGKPGVWQVVAVGKGENSFDSRKPLPEAWMGLTGEKLEKATGVPGALFCHRGRFLCTTDSKEAALKLAKLALES